MFITQSRKLVSIGGKTILNKLVDIELRESCRERKQ
jgi:hypothetical protein